VPHSEIEKSESALLPKGCSEILQIPSIDVNGGSEVALGKAELAEPQIGETRESMDAPQ
jgi:hypothetical protein